MNSGVLGYTVEPFKLCYFICSNVAKKKKKVFIYSWKSCDQLLAFCDLYRSYARNHVNIFKPSTIYLIIVYLIISASLGKNLWGWDLHGNTWHHRCSHNSLVHIFYVEKIRRSVTNYTIKLVLNYKAKCQHYIEIVM